MAPVVARLREEPSRFETSVVATGQHGELCARALAEFGIRADRDLEIARPGQTLAEALARTLEALAHEFRERRPDVVLAQGDTTSVLASALASSYEKIPFGHIEAGLRSGVSGEPFPEELHRRFASKAAFWHFAPTETARDNLLREGIDPKTIHLVGNTVIDALKYFESRTVALPVRPPTERFVLTTVHRRENQGAPLTRICRAIAALVERDRELSVVWPVHPNPKVRDVVYANLAGRQRILLIEPVAHGAFLALLKASSLVLSDSGGVQEEAPAFGKPVAVLRESTERPEAVEVGSSVLVGSNPRKIVATSERLLRVSAVDPDAFRPFNPLGDGMASARIAAVLGSRSRKFSANRRGIGGRGLQLAEGSPIL